MQNDIVSNIEPSSCIRCGKCVDVCPGRIIPTQLSNMATHGDTEGFIGADGLECCECGCCSFICPAKRSLTQDIKSMRKAILASKKK